MTSKNSKTFIERYLLKTNHWKQGYRHFHDLFDKPLGWMVARDEENPEGRLYRVDRKVCCKAYAGSAKACDEFLFSHCEGLFKKGQDQKFKEITCHNKLRCVVFKIDYLKQTRAFFILCNLKKPIKEYSEIAKTFHAFLHSEISLAYKSFELDDFYETVHPRALALSTLHSLHRVISSSLRIDELIPRVGRLSAQILKAKYCSIMLIDEEGYLVPKFTMGEKEPSKHIRHRLGHGLEGKVAQTGEFYFDKKCICVPFIEEDVVGVITLKDKMDDSPFTNIDLEILKTLCEQAVVAIKNAQLFEETEQLTIGSIKSINELLELNYSGDNVHLPIFGKLIHEIGRDMGLNTEELTNLHRAAYLLDTGHIGVPNKIVGKTGRLTKKEYEAIKRHPYRGASILKSIVSLKPLIPTILHHHERYDGKGYPNGLKGEEIPLGARIIAVVDAFTAMVSKRPYRQKMAKMQAIREIKKNSGSQFDPKVVESFLKVIDKIEDI